MDNENKFHFEIERRVQTLESGLSDVHHRLDIAEVRREYIDARFKHVETRFDRLDTNIGKLVWLVIAAIIGGAISFMLKGGFNLAG